ncbi:MAG: formyltransferase family protein [Haloarculaceae archaeon]
MQLAGMASNRGRNLLNVADRAPGDAELAVVVSDEPNAPVLEAAAERGIPTDSVVPRDDEDRRAHERRVLAVLGDYHLDLVCLDGYMRILSDTFIESAPTTLNVHPSLLPAFPGDDAWGDALDAGVTVTGATVHVVVDATDEDGNLIEDRIDCGPAVTQEPVPVFEGDDRATLKDRVLREAEFRAYPRAIRLFAGGRVDVDYDDESVTVSGEEANGLPDRRITTGDRATALRYGENPHQDAALYADYAVAEPNVVDAPQLNEGAKALSYNNFNDADAALDLVKEFDAPAAAVIKHTNPAGAAVADTLADAYADALATDAQSAFGGVVALNRRCDRATAAQIVESYKEIVVAPNYTDGALDVLREKDDLRVLAVGHGAGRAANPEGDEQSGFGEPTARYTEKDLVGGRLVQERDDQDPDMADCEVVTEREPTAAQLETMRFAWRTIKHVKSNAIVFATGMETVGVGMGQVSRVDAVRLAALKAEEHAEGKSADGAVMASDAFFPFPDGIEYAAEAGVEAVVQPGGSQNDEAVVAAADEHDMAMVMTGSRCFRHD